MTYLPYLLNLVKINDKENFVEFCFDSPPMYVNPGTMIEILVWIRTFTCLFNTPLAPDYTKGFVEYPSPLLGKEIIFNMEFSEMYATTIADYEWSKNYKLHRVGYTYTFKHFKVSGSDPFINKSKRVINKQTDGVIINDSTRYIVQALTIAIPKRESSN